MITPIKEKGTVLYGNKGKYKLLKKDGNVVTYLFEPWGDNVTVYDQELRKDDLNKLSEILHMRLLWCCWEDD